MVCYIYMQESLYWGDLHNHNEVGYGEGSLERSFRLARNTLDFYAFTPHTWWPDLPDRDSKVRDKHLAGFKIVKNRWNEVIEILNNFYEEGKFVTIPAWEWHSLRWGDWCVYFPGSSAEYSRAETLTELKQFTSRKGAVIIPHHCAYARGFRGTDWDSFDPEYSPAAEVFSEHGDSMEPESPHGMYGHSMGGSVPSQSALHQLTSGKRFGITASTDDHYGHPGSFGCGLTGLWAEDLNREQIWGSLNSKRTYAVTGDRIGLAFSMGDAFMGGNIPPKDGIPIRISVAGRSALDKIDLIKNGRTFRSWTGGDFSPGRPNISPSLYTGRNSGTGTGKLTGNTKLMRIEWGWDGLSEKGVTRWNISLRSDSGGFSSVEPGFSGGAGSTELENSITTETDKIEISSFTSRMNGSPVSSVTFLHPARGKITMQVWGIKAGAAFSREASFPESWDDPSGNVISTMDYFSSPKIKIHPPLSLEKCTFNLEEPGTVLVPGDWFLLRVTQKNGHRAWSSPIWIND